VNSPDIMPTLLGLSGIAILPSAGHGPFTSATRLPHGQACDHRVSEHARAAANARSDGCEYRGVRNEHYTYVRSIQDPGCSTTIVAIRIKCTICADSRRRAPSRQRSMPN